MIQAPWQRRKSSKARCHMHWLLYLVCFHRYWWLNKSFKIDSVLSTRIQSIRDGGLLAVSRLTEVRPWGYMRRWTSNNSLLVWFVWRIFLFSHHETLKRQAGEAGEHLLDDTQHHFEKRKNQLIQAAPQYRSILHRSVHPKYFDLILPLQHSSNTFFKTIERGILDNGTWSFFSC